jgi:hypothetical protein
MPFLEDWAGPVFALALRAKSGPVLQSQII